MTRIKPDGWILIPSIVILTLFIPNIRQWLNAEMYLKMLVQIPSLTIFSFIIGLQMKNVKNKIMATLGNHGASALIFLFGAQTFWMIPRSLDLAVSSTIADMIMHLNLVTAGFLFGVGFRNASFVLKTAFSIYGLSMALSMGIIYIHFNALICAVYTIEMQHIAGKYTLYVFPFVFILFLFRLFYNMSKLEEETGEIVRGRSAS